VTHHVAAAEEVGIIFDGLGTAVWRAGFFWVLYMALEPHVRRRWPQSLIGWTRLLSHGIRDPLVGAQLLIGCAVGIVFNLLFSGWNLVFVQYGLFHPDPQLGEALVDTRRMAGQFLNALGVSIVQTLMMFFFFFLLRALLRRQWLVWAVWVLLCAGLAGLGGALPAINAVFAAALFPIAKIA
jgi:serine/threonine-protein kinase